MRHNGKIIEWNDARGFGFAVIPGATERHFLHIKSIMGAGRRPRVGDLLSFEVDSASAKGPRAVRVRFANAPGRPAVTAAPKGGRNFATDWALALLMGALLGWNLIIGRLPMWTLPLLAVGSALAFVMYNIDKRRAQRDARRTPEAELLAISAVGWPGALVAQQLFRHKSSKRAFYTAFRVIAMLEAAALLWLGRTPPAT